MPRTTRSNQTQNQNLIDYHITNEDLVDPITQEIIEPPAVLVSPCGHAFGKASIERHMETSERCPCCRGEIVTISEAPPLFKQILEAFRQNQARTSVQNTVANADEEGEHHHREDSRNTSSRPRNSAEIRTVLEARPSANSNSQVPQSSSNQTSNSTTPSRLVRNTQEQTLSEEDNDIMVSIVKNFIKEQFQSLKAYARDQHLLKKAMLFLLGKYIHRNTNEQNDIHRFLNHNSNFLQEVLENPQNLFRQTLKGHIKEKLKKLAKEFLENHLSDLNFSIGSGSISITHKTVTRLHAPQPPLPPRNHQPSSNNNEPFTLLINNLNGGSIRLFARPSDTINEVERQISSDPNARFNYQGHYLDRNTTLAENHLGEGKTLHRVLRFR